MSIRHEVVTLIGVNELLMDRDNLEFAPQLKQWQLDPANKDKQAKGDDRAPAWLWLSKLHYSEAGQQWIGIPTTMLEACLREAARSIPHPSGGNKTLREASMAGIQLLQSLFPLFVQRPHDKTWHPLSFNELYLKLGREEDIAVHQDIVKQTGFLLDIRRSKPPGGHGTRHVRVRPKFVSWRCIVTYAVTDDSLTRETMTTLWDRAGTYKGIGNWRPNLGASGSYGTFSVHAGIPQDVAAVAESLGIAAMPARRHSHNPRVTS